jgi:hypothetical protein
VDEINVILVTFNLLHDINDLVSFPSAFSIDKSRCLCLLLDVLAGTLFHILVPVSLILGKEVILLNVELSSHTLTSAILEVALVY